MKTMRERWLAEGLDSSTDSGRGLKDGDLEPSFLQLIASAKARDTGADDRDLFVFSRV
jgi:hypothetical protein